MNEQNTSQYNEPAQNSKNLWVIVAAVVITALVVGGVVYAWQTLNLKSTEQSFQQQITLLQNQINQLQQAQPSQNIPNNTEPTPPVANNSNLVVYQNQQYGFEFQYPKDWPQPTVTEGYFSGGYPQEKSKWILNIGIIGKGPCEGADCAQYELGGFSYLNYSSALASLQKNEFISEIKEININGLKVITYIESGLRADQTALIFGSTQTLKLVNIWGEKMYFNQIISTFKFIK